MSEKKSWLDQLRNQNLKKELKAEGLNNKTKHNEQDDGAKKCSQILLEDSNILQQSQMVKIMNV